MYLLILLVAVSFINCNKDSSLNKLSDEEFIEFISDDNNRIAIVRIDSLIKIKGYTNYKTGLLYYEKGRVLGNLDKDIEVIGSLNKALTIFEEEKNKKFIAKTNMLLADSNAFLSKNESAVSQINIAIKLFREIGDKKGEAKALNSLAHIEFQFNNFNKSIEYIKQASAIQLEILI